MAKKSLIRSVMKGFVCLGLAGVIFVSAGQVGYAEDMVTSVDTSVVISGEVSPSAPDEAATSTEAPATDDEDDQSSEPTTSAPETTQPETIAPEAAVEVEAVVTAEATTTVIAIEGASSTPELVADQSSASSTAEVVIQPETSEVLVSGPEPVRESVATEIALAAVTLTEIAISHELASATGTHSGLTEIAVSDELSWKTGSFTEIAVSDEYHFTTQSGGGDDDDDDDGGGGGGGGRSRRRAQPAVQGLATSCGPWLTKYIRYGWDNDRVEVAKLQYFLREFEDFKTVQITGVYDEPTLVAVMIFQQRYARDVLNPWGLEDKQPTGFVFITTRMAINNLFCRRSTAHDLDLRHVYDGWQGQSGVGSKEGAGNYDDQAYQFSTSTWEYAPEATGTLQAAALGFINFLKNRGDLLFIILLLTVLAVMGYLLRHSYQKREELANEYYNYPMVIKKPNEPAEEIRVRDEEISAADLKEAEKIDSSPDQSAEEKEK